MDSVREHIGKARLVRTIGRYAGIIGRTMSIRPLLVVFLFLVRDVSKDHAGGW